MQFTIFGKFKYFCGMEWFKTWFNTPYYHILYQDRDYKEGEQFLEKLIDVLNLQPPSKIIDLACGKGRHSVFLNKMGFDVLGLDLSEESISYNKKFETPASFNLTKPSLKFDVHDMRNPIKSEKVDAVFNLFTSFGYFKTDEEDQSVFSSVSNILKENGLFVLDFMNAEFVKNNLVEEEKIKKGNILFTIKKRIENQHIIKEINFNVEGKDLQFEEKVKLLDLSSIEIFAKNVGLERVKLWGDYQLNSFKENSSPRCIILFKKIK
ncbi:class I SAM-dependent DNA methyltransferase [Halpernia sp.]|uniref:class I SAM-dependent DNA methyltransferase n=1 Tax=Halpernia sp. TaxID=2782209 RepID=UPI003A8CD915